MIDRIQLSIKKQVLFSVFASLLVCFIIELICHLLTSIGWLPYSIFTPTIYTRETVKYQLDPNGSPIFTDGQKVYRQPTVPIKIRDYDIEGFAPEDTLRFNKTPTTNYQIGFFGDSYTEGLQVNRQQTFPHLIEQYLENQPNKQNPTICFNFAVGGTGTYHQYLLYLTVSKKTKLNEVVVCFLPQNDILNNHQKLGQPFELPKATYFSTKIDAHTANNTDNFIKSINQRTNWLRKTVGLSFLASGSYRLVKRIQSNGLQRKSDIWAIRQKWLAVYGIPSNQIWKEAWQITESILFQFQQKVVADGAKFTILLVADSLQIGDSAILPIDLVNSLDLSYPNQRLKLWASQNGIDCLDSLPYFLAKKNDLVYPYFSWNDDGHYSSLGHQTIADFWHIKNSEKE